MKMMYCTILKIYISEYGACESVSTKDSFYHQGQELRNDYGQNVRICAFD